MCRNDKTFKDMFESFDSIITHISFDSDGNEVTGYDCVKWLCDYIQDNSLDISNLTLNFHTANPVGKENMETYWKNMKVKIITVGMVKVIYQIQLHHLH